MTFMICNHVSHFGVGLFDFSRTFGCSCHESVITDINLFCAHTLASARVFKLFTPLIARFASSTFSIFTYPRVMSIKSHTPYKCTLLIKFICMQIMTVSELGMPLNLSDSIP